MQTSAKKLAIISSTTKSAASIVVLVVLGLAGWSGRAAAQQPSPAQIGAVRSACRADFQANCAGVQSGGQAALACLKKNVAALSPACQKAVSAVGGGAAAPAAEPPVAAAAAAPPHPNTLSPADTALAAPAGAPAARPVVPLRVELAILRRACGQDVQINCPGVRHGGGRVMACLAANEAALSLRCRRELAMARQNL